MEGAPRMNECEKKNNILVFEYIVVSVMVHQNLSFINKCEKMVLKYPHSDSRRDHMPTYKITATCIQHARCFGIIKFM